MDNAIQALGRTGSLQRALLICGIIAIPIYAASIEIAGALYPGYSAIDQAVSELFAIGAPTSGFVVPLFMLYSLLGLAFAFGVWMAFRENHLGRIMAILLGIGAINGLVLFGFFPMNMRGVEPALTDTMHLVLAASGGILSAVAIGLGAFLFGRKFRYYSIGTIVMLFVPTVLSLSFAPQVAANESSPWMGLLERIAFAVYWQWQIVLAVKLLRGQKHRKAKSEKGVSLSA